MAVNIGNNIFIATVVSNDDKYNVGRVQIYIPALHKDVDMEYLPWANCCSPFGGKSGSYIVPEEGAQVYVMFMGDNYTDPLWFGYFKGLGKTETTFVGGREIGYANSDKAPEMYDKKQNILYRSPKGALISFSDEDENENITFQDALGQSFSIETPLDKELTSENEHLRLGDESLPMDMRENSEGYLKDSTRISVNGIGGSLIIEKIKNGLSNIKLFCKDVALALSDSIGFSINEGSNGITLNKSTMEVAGDDVYLKGNNIHLVASDITLASNTLTIEAIDNIDIKAKNINLIGNVTINGKSIFHVDKCTKSSGKCGGEININEYDDGKTEEKVKEDIEKKYPDSYDGEGGDVIASGVEGIGGGDDLEDETDIEGSGNGDLELVDIEGDTEDKGEDNTTNAEGYPFPPTGMPPYDCYIPDKPPCEGYWLKITQEPCGEGRAPHKWVTKHIYYNENGIGYIKYMYDEDPVPFSDRHFIKQEDGSYICHTAFKKDGTGTMVEGDIKLSADEYNSVYGPDGGQYPKEEKKEGIATTGEGASGDNKDGNNGSSEGQGGDTNASANATANATASASTSDITGDNGQGNKDNANKAEPYVPISAEGYEDNNSHRSKLMTQEELLKKGISPKAPPEGKPPYHLYDSQGNGYYKNEYNMLASNYNQRVVEYTNEDGTSVIRERYNNEGQLVNDTKFDYTYKKDKDGKIVLNEEGKPIISHQEADERVLRPSMNDYGQLNKAYDRDVVIKTGINGVPEPAPVDNIDVNAPTTPKLDNKTENPASEYVSPTDPTQIKMNDGSGGAIISKPVSTTPSEYELNKNLSNKEGIVLTRNHNDKGELLEQHYEKVIDADGNKQIVDWYYYESMKAYLYSHYIIDKDGNILWERAESEIDIPDNPVDLKEGKDY